MPSARTALVALAVLGSLTGCGDSDDRTDASTPTTPIMSASPDTTPTGSASSTADAPSVSSSPSTAATSGATQAACGPGLVPDGSWQGPITMQIRGTGGQNGYADSVGDGRLRMTVKDGKVTGGTWSLTWRSHGEANTAAASATVDLTGKVDGTVQGSASKPRLPDTWSIKGRTVITKPTNVSAPFSETGQDSETMTIKQSTCDQVTGTFVPSFNSVETAATFTGTATWVGTRR